MKPKKEKKNEKTKVTIKSISLDVIARVIELFATIVEQFETWHSLWRNWKLKRKQKRTLEEAEKALKDKDIEKINDIIHRRH
jgi:oligoribonuclease NrnB/cAMP/cGMP phosphodiesterase (DHH superfamily)